MVKDERIAIFASRANLMWVKQRALSAQKGLALLKRKRDALLIHLRHIIAELKVEREQMNTLMNEAIFSIARANFCGTDFKPVGVFYPARADSYLLPVNTKVIGINVPTFELIMKETKALKFVGLSSGGQQVQDVKTAFQEALKVLVKVASLDYSKSLLDVVIKQNNMRVNALQFVVLPRYQKTVHYITEELDEYEREDFYRLKRSQAKQLKKKLEFMQIIKERAKLRDLPEEDTNLL